MEGDLPATFDSELLPTEIVPVIDKAATDHEFGIATRSHDRGKPRPTIREASLDWTLCAEQHAAFAVLASSLLERLLPTETLCESQQVKRQRANATSVLKQLMSSPVDPLEGLDLLSTPVTAHSLFMFLTGAGGTGKSQVVKALVDFAKRWNALKAIVVAATTGVAGSALTGVTYHRALGLGLDGTFSDATVRQIERWHSVALLVIDEVSMAAPKALVLIDRRLRDLRQKKDVLFGGVHVCFAGDLFQLKPVKSAATFYREKLPGNYRYALAHMCRTPPPSQC